MKTGISRFHLSHVCKPNKTKWIKTIFPNELLRSGMCRIWSPFTARGTPELFSCVRWPCQVWGELYDFCQNLLPCTLKDNLNSQWSIAVNAVLYWMFSITKPLFSILSPAMFPLVETVANNICRMTYFWRNQWTQHGETRDSTRCSAPRAADAPSGHIQHCSCDSPRAVRGWAWVVSPRATTT